MGIPRVPRRATAAQSQLSTAQGLIQRRHFHATKSQPVWYLAVGAGLTALYVGGTFALRVRERMRRKREGLPLDDDEYDDEYDDQGQYAAPRRRLDRILGLDFGTANLRLATATPFSTSDRARVLVNAEGLRAIPAAVAVENESVLVGALAKSLQGRKPGYTATATRLLLGQTPEFLATDEFAKSLPYKIQADGDKLQLFLDDKAYSTEWAAEVMLDHMHDMAARSLGDEAFAGFPAVIAVPVGSTDAQRSAMERVAVTAGFDLVSSVEEPIAAMHAVERVVAEEETEDQFKGAFTGRSSGPIVVFDMGGFATSVSLLERSDSTYSLLASKTTTNVSGNTVDSLLFRRVVDRFYQEVGIDLSIDHMARYRILEAMEAAKMELSTRRSTDINLPFITADRTGAKHLVQKLSTFDLSRVLEGPVKEAITLCDAALKESGLRKENIGLLVLIGGGVRSEVIRTELERYFKLSAFTSKDFSPEEAVVVGATEYGRKLLLEDA